MAAGQSWSLPLNGYYRPGRYMPVHFHAQAGDLRLCPDGRVTTLIPSPSGGIAPCFMSGNPSPASPWAAALHELRPTDRLIGLATDRLTSGTEKITEKIAAQLFPADAILIVPLDPVNPLPGPPQAWQTLDALVISRGALNDWQTRCLLAGGTTLIIPGGSASPDANWPWKQSASAPASSASDSSPSASFWFLQTPSTLNAAANDDAYNPISNWLPGRSADYRRQILFLGLAVGAAMLLVSFWRSRWQSLTGVITAIISVAAIGAWDNHQSPISEITGQVQFPSSPAAVDRWSFQRAARTCDMVFPADDLTLPMLPQHGGPQEITLHCTTTGTPEFFTYHLPMDRPAIFVTKDLSVVIPASPLPLRPPTSPMRFLPTSLYPGSILLGESAASPGDENQWPALVFASSDAIPKYVNPASGRDSSNR